MWPETDANAGNDICHYSTVVLFMQAFFLYFIQSSVLEQVGRIQVADLTGTPTGNLLRYTELHAHFVGTQIRRLAQVEKEIDLPECVKNSRYQRKRLPVDWLGEKLSSQRYSHFIYEFSIQIEK
jgi:hypothetical protein